MVCGNRPTTPAWFSVHLNGTPSSVAPSFAAMVDAMTEEAMDTEDVADLSPIESLAREFRFPGWIDRCSRYGETHFRLLEKEGMIHPGKDGWITPTGLAAIAENGVFVPEGVARWARFPWRRFDCVGLRHADWSMVKNRVRAGSVVSLRREPDNLHDRNAIRVLFQEAGHPPTDIGYVERGRAAEIAPAMDGVMTMDAVVRSVEPMKLVLEGA